MKTRYDEVREFRNNYGVVRNVNNKRISKLPNYNVVKRKIALMLSFLSIATAITIFSAIPKGHASELPEDSVSRVVLNIPKKIENGETLSEIAEDNYSDSYTEFYVSKQDYIEEIKSVNNIQNSDIYANDTIMVPIVLDSSNAYYQKIQELNKQIEEIIQNNYWVEYTVKYGDNISVLAAQASSTQEETIENTKKILSKNNISGYLQAGQVIYTINPKLGVLKSELNETLNELGNYLEGTNKKAI